MSKLIRCPSCHERIAMPDDDFDDVRCPSCGAHVSGGRPARPERRQNKSSGTGLKIVIAIFGVLGLLVVLCGGGIYAAWRWMTAPTAFPMQTEDYAVARNGFRTSLLITGPAPQPWDPQVPPADVIEIPYQSGPHKLKAWMSKPDGNGGKLPAVLFLHGGFAFGADDWDQVEPFRAAGFAVMVPILRGENGLPGHYSMFYDEVEDVLAAANVLAKQPNVDPQRIYVAGHSVGGTLAMLASMTSNRFRAGASFSGSPDQVKWSRGQPAGVVPFAQNNPREFQMRSPLAFARSFKCPMRLYYGDEELLFESSTRKTAELAQAAGLDVQAVKVPGDHMDSVEPAMTEAITFFRQK